MALTINYPDRIIAGLNQSYTITSDEGRPTVKVRLNSSELPHRLVPLGPPKGAAESSTPVMKYKVTFHLPDGAAGGTLGVEVESGASRLDESRPVVES